MGGSAWSDADYSARQQTRAATGATAFQYSQTAQATGNVVVHPRMDANSMKLHTGCKARESRDSAAHPCSTPIAVWFDVTGSMTSVPVVLQKKLGQLMKTITTHNYVDDPQILFGAIGDARTDRVPLQVGEFESGLEMDDVLGLVVLEGNGGGQGSESYELIPYLMSRHTVTDAWEKRGRKGYLFTIGDERPCHAVFRDHVKRLVGVDIEADIPFKEIVAEVLEKWEWFHVIPLAATDEQGNLYQTSHGRESVDEWKKFLHERVIVLDDAAAICSTISMYIAYLEGAIDSPDEGADHLAKSGDDSDHTRMASKALAIFTGSRSVARVAKSNIPPATATADDGRL